MEQKLIKLEMKDENGTSKIDQEVLQAVKKIMGPLVILDKSKLGPYLKKAQGQLKYIWYYLPNRNWRNELERDIFLSLTRAILKATVGTTWKVNVKVKEITLAEFMEEVGLKGDEWQKLEVFEEKLNVERKLFQFFFIGLVEIFPSKDLEETCSPLSWKEPIPLKVIEEYTLDDWTLGVAKCDFHGGLGLVIDPNMKHSYLAFDIHDSKVYDPLNFCFAIAEMKIANGKEKEAEEIIKKVYDMVFERLLLKCSRDFSIS